MLEPLRNRTYRHLFAAQIVALIGTGLLTVALGLLAYDLAGQNAGAVLGTALAIKMIAYIGIAPIAGAVAGVLPRRAMLVSLDLVRALIAFGLPFITQVWQIYVLIFVLQAASAAFTPTFQATIPDILPEEENYTQALSLSRIAYDLESLLSPLLAAALLTVISFHVLFAGTAIGFLLSAVFVVSVSLPQPKPSQTSSFAERLTLGLRIFLVTPRLRGLLAVNLSAAAAGAIVFVNTVVVVRNALGFDDRTVALTLAAFGLGSMAAALALPRIIERHTDRTAMLLGAAIMTAGLVAASLALWTLAGTAAWAVLLPLWSVLGIGYGMMLTPTGRLLRRSAHDADRPGLFAAQFALSHACWLLTYPIAGWAGATIGLPATLLLHAAIAGLALAAATQLWPRNDPDTIVHTHADLPASHHHLQGEGSQSKHAHIFVIDALHRRWPS
jgi:MFS family permease